jgi:hypothetical protein
LTLIPWIPGPVHVVGFFANLVLIASFVGLGVGMARPTSVPTAVGRLLLRLSLVAAILGLVHVADPQIVLPQNSDHGLNEVVLDVGISVPMPLILILVFGGTRRLDGQMFFLGAGFLLIETKSVTQYALLVGSTWQTNSLVFAVIPVANLVVLTKAEAATHPCALRRTNRRAARVVRLGDRVTATGSRRCRVRSGRCLPGVPIFLAAIVFAVGFRGARLGSEALASNLLGAILGGTLEYLSLAWGIRAMSLLAAGMYLAAFGFWTIHRRRGARDDAATPDPALGAAEAAP